MSDASSSYGVPTVSFVWGQFAPYHRDRCEAVAERLAGRYRVVGVEIASRNENYAWADVGQGQGFSRITLLPGKTWQETTWRERLRALNAELARHTGPVFLCHFNEPEIFLTACRLRLQGRRVFAMSDSKFDDKPRHLWREFGKALMYMPYNGALASGARTRDYLRLLGFRESNIELGYDSVSVDRIRRLAGAPPAPDGSPFTARHFTVVARFVEKKNLPTLLAAYDLYCQAGPTPRELVLVGDGPLAEQLHAEVARRNLSGVRFAGFLQEEDVAQTLANTLALILPSTEEQWGLVVNEAVAMGLPVLCSDNVGARDELVRSGLNGYVVEPDNVDGLARLMFRIASDEIEWRRLAEGSLALAPKADTARFAAAVAALISDVSAGRTI